MFLKNLIFSVFVFAIFIPNCLLAQVPDGFVYQLVVRDQQARVVQNELVSVEISVRPGSATGQPVYVETHTDSTTGSGLLSVLIGAGDSQSGDLSAIDWSDGMYFLSVRIDPEGGTDFGSALSIRIVSVPYALYAERSDSAKISMHVDTLAISVSGEGDTLFVGSGGQYIIVPGLSEANQEETCQNDTTAVVEVTSASSRVWMDRNLGASQVATSTIDSLGIGSLFQWGRAADGHQCRESEVLYQSASTATPSTGAEWDGKFLAGSNNWLYPAVGTLWQGVNGANNPCPSGFRLPTESEWVDEFNSWNKYGGNITVLSAFESPLKLPAGGYRKSQNGFLTDFAVGGYYWTSTVSSYYSQYFFFEDKPDNISPNDRARGHSVRCIKDQTPP